MKKPKSKRSLEIALRSVEKNLALCTTEAIPGYVWRLAGEAIALRFALGWTEQQNYIRHIAICAPAQRAFKTIKDIPDDKDLTEWEISLYLKPAEGVRVMNLEKD